MSEWTEKPEMAKGPNDTNIRQSKAEESGQKGRWWLNGDKFQSHSENSKISREGWGKKRMPKMLTCNSHDTFNIRNE